MTDIDWRFLLAFPPALIAVIPTGLTP